ncbi:MAG: hypothetical protein QOE05_3664 [Actinomycetota bacterium]|jgi:hypothetical protein|nr:hypothetical protein [Actinomycetota bacterium]
MTITEAAVRTRRVFLLLQIDPGRALEARDFLLGTDGISELAATTGPFDVIVVADIADTVEVERLVAQCRRAPGLTRLSRCQAAAAER